MTEAIVHGFEVVQIEHQATQGLLMAHAACPLMAQLLLERAAIQEAGQGVGLAITQRCDSAAANCRTSMLSKGLPQDEEPVSSAQRSTNIFPTIVGIGRRDYHQELWIELPHLADGLDAVAARRHADIDEGDRIGTSFGQGLLNETDRIISLKGGVDFVGVKFCQSAFRHYITEQLRFRLARPACSVAWGAMIFR